MEFETAIIFDNLDAILLGLKWTLIMVGGSLVLGIGLGLADFLRDFVGAISESDT